MAAGLASTRGRAHGSRVLLDQCGIRAGIGTEIHFSHISGGNSQVSLSTTLRTTPSQCCSQVGIEHRNRKLGFMQGYTPGKAPGRNPLESSSFWWPYKFLGMQPIFPSAFSGFILEAFSDSYKTAVSGFRAYCNPV